MGLPVNGWTTIRVASSNQGLEFKGLGHTRRGAREAVRTRRGAREVSREAARTGRGAREAARTGSPSPTETKSNVAVRTTSLTGQTANMMATVRLSQIALIFTRSRFFKYSRGGEIRGV